MADLIAVTFDNVDAAFRARKALLSLRADETTSVEGPAVITRDDKGDFALEQSQNPVSPAALGGTMLGVMIGTVFLSPLIGAVIGAGAGTAAGLAVSSGLDQTARDELRSAVPEGGAAALILVDEDAEATRGLVDRIAQAAPTGRVTRRTISSEEESRVRAMMGSEAPSV